MLKTIETPYWIVCYDDSAVDQLDDNTCGKWMFYFSFSEMSKTFDIIRAAVTENICAEAKMSNVVNIELHNGSGVVCFYINGNDDNQHKTVIHFMLVHNLFEQDENGTLIDAPFKFDWQTAAGQYDDSFVPEIVLSDFIDLKTKQFL